MYLSKELKKINPIQSVIISVAETINKLPKPILTVHCKELSMEESCAFRE